MKALRRSAASAWRVLKGGAQDVRDRVAWQSRLQAVESADVVSLDIFDTLLLKAPSHDRDVFDAVSGRILANIEKLAVHGLPDEIAVRTSLNRVHRDLMHQAVARGNDPAISRRAVYEAFFRSLASSSPSNTTVEELLRYELQLHYELTALNPEVLKFIQFCKSARKRVIAISDTYLGAEELASLLQMHGFKGLDAIYASCDVGYSKFRGGLFEKVLAQEKVPPDRVLHIGDSRLADVYSARSSGIRGVLYRRNGLELSWDESGFRLGFESLGPVFAAFCHLLLLEVKRVGVSRLAFVARDGDFLREATARLMSVAPSLPQPKLDYVYLSRRATALPARSRLDRSDLEEVQRVRAEGRIVDLFFEYFGLDRAAFVRTGGGDAGSVARLLDDPEFQEFVKRQRERQSVLLADYLRREGLFSGGDVALVDVGWRGSTQKALSGAFGADADFVAPHFYYLALWSEFGPTPAPGGPAVGILADQRRSGSIQESAAWHLAFLIEAVCRASHGTVTGFMRDPSGAVQPRLASDTLGRRAETVAEPSRESIRRGILAYLNHYGRGLSSAIHEASLRRRALRRMLRLAFFPRRWELDAVFSMVHTEGHAADWSAPLISSERVHPLRSPRRWMAGLKSPWRAGYVAATGGFPFALAFFCLESLLGATPPGLRRRLRQWALKWTRRTDPLEVPSD